MDSSRVYSARIFGEEQTISSNLVVQDPATTKHFNLQQGLCCKSARPNGLTFISLLTCVWALAPFPLITSCQSHSCSRYPSHNPNYFVSAGGRPEWSTLCPGPSLSSFRSHSLPIPPILWSIESRLRYVESFLDSGHVDLGLIRSQIGWEDWCHWGIPDRWVTKWPSGSSESNTHAVEAGPKSSALPFDIRFFQKSSRGEVHTRHQLHSLSLDSSSEHKVQIYLWWGLCWQLETGYPQIMIYW
jgi:hypothetical protein